MKHQIRESADKTFFYLISIDDQNNETVVAESINIKELNGHPDVEKLPDMKAIPEANTRGTVELAEEENG